MSNVAVFLIDLLLVVLPFERIPTLTVSGVSLRLSTLVGLVLLAVLFWSRSTWRSSRQTLTPLEWPALGLLVLAWLSLLWAKDLRFAFIGAGSLTFTMLAAYALSRLVNHQTDWRRLELTLVAVALGLFLFAAWQEIAALANLPASLTLLSAPYEKPVLGFPRIQGFSLEPLYFANFLLFLLPVPLLIAARRTGRSRLSYWLLAPAIMLALLLPVTRSGNLALLGGCLILVLVMSTLPKPVPTLSRLVWLTLLTGLVFWLVVQTSINHLPGHYAIDTHNYYRQLLVGDFGASDSTTGRLVRWRDALELWRAHPLGGLGMSNYGSQTLLPATSTTHGHPIVNNLYLELLTELGPVGLFLFILFIYQILRSLIRRLHTVSDPAQKYRGLWLFFALIATLIQYNFFSTLYILPVWVLIGLTLAYLYSPQS